MTPVAEPPAADPSGPTASIFFVGNATTVIRCGGFTVLTDRELPVQG